MCERSGWIRHLVMGCSTVHLHVSALNSSRLSGVEAVGGCLMGKTEAVLFQFLIMNTPFRSNKPPFPELSLAKLRVVLHRGGRWGEVRASQCRDLSEPQ